MTSAPPRIDPPSGPDTPEAMLQFYTDSLDAADRSAIDDARKLTGLAEEIALLRLHLRDVLRARPENARLLETGVRVLIQALLAEHRLSGKDASGLMGAIASLAEYMRDLVYGGPPDA